MIRVEYIGHSGVLVELEKINLMFDVIGFEGMPRESSNGFVHDVGALPRLDKTKDTVVFISHNHADHYSEKIWELRRTLDKVKYIISKDVHFSSGVRKRIGVSDEYSENVLRVKSYTKNEVELAGGNKINVQTIPSTDEGVAFLVRAEGHIIYHAGDHHMWMWDANGQEYMDAMRADFTGAISKLELDENEVIDVAFLLLDPRLGNHAYDGIDTYLENLPIKNIIPIHQWKEYSLTDDYIADRADSLGDVVIYKVTGENCEIKIS